MSGDPFDNLDALLTAQLGNPAVAETVDPKGRRKRDKQMSRSPNLGRPSKGRHAQFNCKMREELHRRIKQVSRTSGKSIVEMAEEAFTEYLAKLGERPMPSLTRIAVYGLAGIPALIGVAFVARYAFVTSDAAIDGASSAFLFGMIAVGAFAGPACAIAAYNNRRRTAAGFLGVLSALAIVVNWSHGLAAIAHRGAGTEAQSIKDAKTEADARAALARIESDLGRLSFMPTTAATVTAAERSVASAVTIRQRECGNGDPRQRGPNCRQRETEEQAARAALTQAEQNKSATDRAEGLEAKAAAIRAALANTQPAKPTNSLGEALGRILSVSAVTAATLQQGLVSAIAELIIAAALALPELLRKPNTTAARPTETAPLAEVNAPPTPPAEIDTLGRFMLACLRKAPGEEVAARAIYRAYRSWCVEQLPALDALDVAAFAEQFAARCKRLGIRTRREPDGSIACLGVTLNAPANRQRLGHLAMRRSA